jgi:hypothetical protein
METITKLTVEDAIKLRIALHSSERVLKRLVQSEKGWEVYYQGILDEIAEAKETLKQSIDKE